MKICNCALPYSSPLGHKVCEKCANNVEYDTAINTATKLSMDKILEIAKECGVEVSDNPDGNHYIIGDDGECLILDFKNKCEYCEVKNTFSGYGMSLISKPYISIGIVKQDIVNEYYLITNEYEELSNIRGIYSNSPFRSDKIKINYCPMCGREL